MISTVPRMSYLVGVTTVLGVVAMTALPCQGFVSPVLRSVRSGRTDFPVSALSMVSTTPAPKYPVQRGEELDSRKIVTSARQHLTAIRLNHILFASEALAVQTLHELRIAALAFDELALQISNCAITREERGHVGWVSLDSTKNDHLDLVLPPDARNKVVLMNTKVSAR
jgi:hypothetical protein